MDPSIENNDLLHQPAMIVIMAGILLLCLFAAVVNLRNARLWMLRLRGTGTSGVVQAMEVVTDPNGEVLRRPRVAYTTPAGAAVTATPLVYRPRSALDVGASVRVRYAQRRPERMVVYGFDVRIREMVFAALSVAVAIAVIVGYFARL